MYGDNMIPEKVTTGDEVKVKRPAKNPKEEKVENPDAGEVVEG